MNENIFKGLFTALITPFEENEKIDFEALELILQKQIEAKVDGIILLGTTGEKATLNKTEWNEIIRFATNFVKNKIKIIVNIGTNNTNETIEDISLIEKYKIDGLMTVNPYYNKPTQDGMFLHFERIAQSTDLPIMLYNIISRTGVNLQVKTIEKLLKYKNIKAIKESSGDISHLMNIIKYCGSDCFSILSGEESLNYSIIKLGGLGAVSVLSNLIPLEIKEFIDLCLNRKGDEKKALEMHYKFLELFNIIFQIGSNPTAIKTIMAEYSLIKEFFRLPLTKLTEKEKQELMLPFRHFEFRL